MGNRVDGWIGIVWSHWILSFGISYADDGVKSTFVTVEQDAEFTDVIKLSYVKDVNCLKIIQDLDREEEDPHDS